MTDPTLLQCVFAGVVTIGSVLVVCARQTRRPARLPRRWNDERRAKFFGP